MIKCSDFIFSLTHMVTFNVIRNYALRNSTLDQLLR